MHLGVPRLGTERLSKIYLVSMEILLAELFRKQFLWIISTDFHIVGYRFVAFAPNCPAEQRFQLPTEVSMHSNNLTASETQYIVAPYPSFM